MCNIYLLNLLKRVTIKTIFRMFSFIDTDQSEYSQENYFLKCLYRYTALLI